MILFIKSNILVLIIFSLFALPGLATHICSQLTFGGATDNIRSWSLWEPFGTEAFKNPVVVKDSQGRLNLFIVANDSSLYYKTQNISAQENGTGPWSEWRHLGGILKQEPSVVVDSLGRLNVFVIGNDSSIYYRTQNISGEENGMFWSEWHGLGGTFKGNPALVQDSQARLNVFVVGNDSSLYYKYQKSSTQEGSDDQWSGWNSLGGEVEPNPVVVSDREGKLNIFVRGSDDALYYNILAPSYQEAQSSGWYGMGGTLKGDAAVVSDREGKFHIFVRGSDDALYYNIMAPSYREAQSSAGWYGLGGTLKGDPSAIQDSLGRLNVFGVANDSSLYYKTQNISSMADIGSRWFGWKGLEGNLQGDPVLIVDSQDRLNVFALGTDREVYKKLGIKN